MNNKLLIAFALLAAHMPLQMPAADHPVEHDDIATVTKVERLQKRHAGRVYFNPRYVNLIALGRDRRALLGRYRYHPDQRSAQASAIQDQYTKITQAINHQYDILKELIDNKQSRDRLIHQAIQQDDVPGLIIIFEQTEQPEDLSDLYALAERSSSHQVQEYLAYLDPSLEEGPLVKSAAFGVSKPRKNTDEKDADHDETAAE